MLLVMVGGFLIHRALSKEDAPARDFLQLELAGADAEHTGSCYALSTVLIANLPFSTATRTWTLRDDAWTLTLEEVAQGQGGPVRVFQKFTFEKHDDRVRLVSVEASQGLPTEVGPNIDDLLRAPNARHSTPVDRCLDPGAAHYRFRPRR